MATNLRAVIGTAPTTALVRRYYQKRVDREPGFNMSELARRVDRSPREIQFLMSGWQGTSEFLGIRGARGSEPLLKSVARELEIPKEEVQRALKKLQQQRLERMDFDEPPSTVGAAGRIVRAAI